MSTTRRDFIRYVVAGSVAAGCPIDLSLLAADSPSAEVDGDHYRGVPPIRDGHSFAHPRRRDGDQRCSAASWTPASCCLLHNTLLWRETSSRQGI